MVHLDKTEGQKGSMVLTEDGSIVASSGDLSSSESTAQTIMSLMAQTLKVDFFNDNFNSQNGVAGTEGAGGAAGPAGDNNSAKLTTKWNRVTVSFEDHAYMACLSNKKIHVVKRETPQPTSSHHHHQDIDH